MRRTFLLLLLAVTISAFADGGYDYPFMVFTTTDGQQTAVSVEGLRMNVSGGVLTVEAGEQTVAFQLENLAEMHFAETDVATGIGEVKSEKLKENNSADVYDLAGRRVDGTQLLPGVYVMKKGNSTAKIFVR